MNDVRPQCQERRQLRNQQSEAELYSECVIMWLTFWEHMTRSTALHHLLGPEVAVLQERTRRRLGLVMLALHLVKLAWAVDWRVETLVALFLLPFLEGKHLSSCLLYPISLNWVDVILFAVCVSQLSMHHQLHRLLFPPSHQTKISNTFVLLISTLQQLIQTMMKGLKMAMPGYQKTWQLSPACIHGWETVSNWLN